MPTKTRPLVPDTLMVPLGARATQMFGICADNWTDGQIQALRADLPAEYHNVPLDALRRQWINIRKRGTDGYSLGGAAAARGSRVKAKRRPMPERVKLYLQSAEWEFMAEPKLKDIWQHRCSTCDVSDQKAQLVPHWRNYARSNILAATDCLMLCRRCKEALDAAIPEDEDGMLF